jgi:hypothetical protein
MKVQSYILISFGLIFVLSYQNCSRAPKFTDVSAASKATNNTDENGRPYDGKIYVLTGDICPDGTKVRARIVLKSSTSADLVRENCAEITPVVLTASEFQLSASQPGEMIYKNQTFVNALIGTKLDMSVFYSDGGFAWMNTMDFPSSPDTQTNTTASTLQIYEDGMPLGPAHSGHPDIRNIGLGRFSHRDGGTGSALRFASSDNTDPRINGRTYTWTVK